MHVVVLRTLTALGSGVKVAMKDTVSLTQIGLAGLTIADFRHHGASGHESGRQSQVFKASASFAKEVIPTRH